MRLIADIHISPRTVRFLNSIGHDVLPVQSVLPPDAPDPEIVRMASRLGRVVLTQDLGFSGILAKAGLAKPSLVSLRLSDPRVANVNRRLRQVLATLEDDVADGIMATVENDRVRIRRLPV